MSSATEQSGTIAVVHDFICLFTHDLKRKQKRWQDGKLKYHCFNKKLMVYDDRGNFVGESHWQEDGDLEDGCELALERGGALVQVAERIRSHTQDLTDLVEKRAKDVEARRASKAGRIGGTSTPHASRHAPVHAHHLQRPLASLVASPGPIGRAIVPSVSPYEARVADRGLYKVAEPRASSKRQRSVSPPSKMGHARALFGTQLTLSATPLNLSQARRSVLSQRTVNVPPSGPSTEDMRGGKDPSPDVVERSSIHQKASAERTGRAERKKEPAAQAMTRQVILDDSPEPEPEPEPQPHLEPGHGLRAQAVKYSGPEQLPPHTDVGECISEELQAKPLLENLKARHLSKRTRSPSLGAEAAAKRQHLEDETSNQTQTTSVAPPSSVPRQSMSKHVVDLTEQMTPEISAPMKSKESTGPAARSEKKLSKSHDQKMGPVVAKSQTESERAPQPGERDTPSEATTIPTLRRADSRGDGPRTELRIRPRQRRGLLMISERIPKNPPKPVAAGSLDSSKKTTEDACKTTATEDELSGAREEVRQTTKPPKGVTLDEQDKRFEDWLEAESIDSLKSAITVAPESRTKAKSSASNGQSRAKRKAKANVEDVADREERQGTTSNGEDESIEGTVQKKGPRIARMARKSVKSKEIIGFVPEPDIRLQMPFSKQSSYMGESFGFNSTSSDLGQPTDDSALENATDATVTRRDDTIIEEEPGVPKGQQLSKTRQEAGPTPRQDLARRKKCNEERLSLQALPKGTVPSRTSVAAVPSDGSPPMAMHLLQEAALSSLAAEQPGDSKGASERPVAHPRDQELGPTPFHSVTTIDAKQHHLENETLISGPTTTSPAQASAGTARLSPHETPSVLAAEETALSRNTPTGSHIREPESSSSNNSLRSSGARQISNPATRGRKAAAKKDAAGMAPRTLVQLDPPRLIIARKAAPAAVTAITTLGPSPVATNLSSAFTVASGGAWSKHAGDLLGMGRPERGIRQ